MTAQEYLKEHGINKETEEKYGISSDKDYLHIPIKDPEGNLSFTKSRNLNFPDNGEPKYKNSAGSKATLFNLDAVKDSANIVLCEGEIDCIRLMQEGIPSVSSTGGAGTFLSEWDPYFENKNVWIAFDNDDAGKKGVYKVVEHIPHARILELPEGSKDICEFFQTYKKKDFAQLLKNSPTVPEWEAKNFPEDFTLISGAELVSMEFEEHNWLIKDIIYSEGFCFLYGAEGTGKSYLALSIAKAVATGENWLDHFEVPRPLNVLVLDKENPLSMLSKRTKGLNAGSENIHFLKYPEKFSLSNSKGEATAFAIALSNIVQQKDIKLIVIDSFVDLMVGNESSSEDTQAFFNGLRVLFPGIAFLVLHHENKPSQGVFRSDSQRLRGSSNINAQTFTMFRLEQVAKSKTEMTIKQTKARDSMKLDKFMLRMDIKTLEDGNSTVTGFTYLGVIEEGLDDTKADEVKTVISEMIGMKKYISQQDILDVCSGRGISARTARRAIKEMIENGSINEFKKGREKWYSAGMFAEENSGHDDDLDPSEIFDGGL